MKTKPEESVRAQMHELKIKEKGKGMKTKTTREIHELEIKEKGLEPSALSSNNSTC